MRGGYAHGATDEFALHAAAVLHLFGLDKDKLRLKRNARDTTLTDGAGSVVKKILA